jgi:hypothetical protein
MYFVGRERAWHIARDWALKAEDASDHEIRELFERLRDKWIDIANKCELVDSEEIMGNRSAVQEQG